MNAAIIINLNAGAIRRKPGRVERLRALAHGRAEVLCTADATELASTCEALAKRDCEHVGIVGGDGSASTTLTALWNAWGGRPLPSVALLGGGTMNTIARSLRVPRLDVVELAGRALDAWAGLPKTRLRPTLHVANRLGFLFGTGAFYGFLDHYYRAADGQPTRLTAVRVLAHGMASAFTGGPIMRTMLPMTPFDVDAEQGHWPRRHYLTVAAGTVADAGLGFRPFHRAFESEDHLQLLGVFGRPREVALELPRLTLGAGLPRSVAESVLVRSFTLHAPEGPFGYSLDGDLREAEGDLKVALGPKVSFLTLSI